MLIKLLNRVFMFFFTFKGSSYKGYCLVDDKLFVTKLTSKTPEEATKNAILQALAYFNYTLDENVDGFAFSHVHRDFFNLHFSNRFSPLRKCPSQNMGWINKCFVDQGILMDGEQIDMQLLRERMGLLFSTRYNHCD